MKWRKTGIRKMRHLKSENYAKEMGEILGDYVGFSGYGEQLGRQQFNQTMSVIVFE